eukprot:COSAG01_NODE_1372_length_10545_cov_12.262876_6_plen_228_part_00
MSAFCIGRGIISPQFHYLPDDTPEVKLRTMADERSDVETQLLLFSSAMDAARTAIAIIRDLQQVVGTVERVTDFIALLERVGKNKRAQLGESVVNGDTVAFEHVDIYTVSATQPPMHVIDYHTWITTSLPIAIAAFAREYAEHGSLCVDTGGGQERSARATRKGSANLNETTTTPWHSGLDHVARWEDVLSLGEQQRLSLARLFWYAWLLSNVICLCQLVVLCRQFH